MRRTTGMSEGGEVRATRRPRWLLPFEVLFFATFAINGYLAISFYWTWLPQVEPTFELIALLDLAWALSIIPVTVWYFSVPRARREEA